MGNRQEMDPVDEKPLTERQRHLRDAYDVEAQGARTDFLRALGKGEVETGLEDGHDYHMHLMISPLVLTRATRGATRGVRYGP